MREHGGDIYDKGRELLDFSSNVNFLGLPAGVKKALVDNIDIYDRYPDPQNRELLQALADYYSINADKIVCGNGAADLIYRITLAIKPKSAVLLTPCFSEYEAALSFCGAEINHHRLAEEEDFQLTEPLSGEFVVICNPNNPTGVPVSAEIIRKTAETSKFILVDECFMDFLPEGSTYSFIPYLENYPNVIVLKAFTKVYAMAGLRLGFLLCADTALSQSVKNTLQPWSVSTVASKCGVAALKETAYLDKTKVVTSHNREIFTEALRDLGLKVFDSAANYILFNYSSSDLKERLLAHNILIRSCANFRGLDGTFYRAAVRSEADNISFVRAMEKIING